MMSVFRSKLVTLLTYAVLVCGLVSFNTFANSTALIHSLASEKKVLMVGTLKGNYIPYFGVKENNKVGGIYPEYIEHLAAGLNLQIQYQFYSSITQLENAAKQGRIDIALGLQQSDERKGYLTLSKTILSVPRTALIAKELNKSPFQLAANPEVNLAVFKYDVDKAYIKQLYPELKKLDIKQQRDLAPALNYGLANAHFSDSLSNQYLAAHLDTDKFSTITLPHVPNKQFHIPLIKNNTALNKAINELISNTNPITVSAIVAHASQWQHYSKKPVMVITPEQQDWLKQHKVIRYTTLPQWHTITMYDESNKPMGLSINVLNRIATLLGVTLEYVPSSSIEEAMQFIQQGKVDVIPAILSTQQRRNNMHFTQPYLTTPWAIVALKNSQLDVTRLLEGEYNIASPNGDYARAIILEYFKNSTLLPVNNMEQSLALLDQGDADVIFSTLATSQSWLKHKDGHNYRLIENFLVNNNIDVQLAVSKHSQPLLPILNNALDAIGYEALEDISRSWIELNTRQGINTKKIIFYSLLACAVFLLVVVGFLYWNQKLRQEVNIRRVAQHRALQAEQKLTSIANAIPGAVVQFKITRNQLIFTYASQGIERFTPFKQINLSATQTVNLNDKDFFTLISKAQVEQLIDAANQALIDNQGIDFECELNAPYKNWLNLVAFPTSTGDDCVWSGVLLEINQRKEQEIALSEEKTKAEQAAIAKSRFLAMMSHEIRTPLSGVITTTELLSQSQLDSQQRDDVNTITASANNLLHILNDVLDHTKMEEQQFAIEKVECDLLVVTENAIRAHIANAQAKGLRMNFYFDPLLNRFIETDPVRLQQVLSNLISNAVKFTEQGHINITVTATTTEHNLQQVAFTVSDSGLGIAAENQSKLFTPFMQAESSTNRQYGGTGLGLSICRMLVNRLGGDINLASHLGQGSEFSFTIPLESYKPSQWPTSLNKKQLVILDDGSECIANVVLYLKQWQLDFVHVTDLVNPEQWHNPERYNNSMIIFHHQLANIVQLKAVDASNVWVKLCEVANNDASADHFIATNPLLISSLLKLLAHADDKLAENLNYVEQQQQVQLQTKAQAIATGRLILVAEDHPTNRRVIKRQLESLGYQADYVENGIQALDAIAKQQYNLLITDCHMPELDGYGLTQQLRQQGNSMPIIAFTANALTGEAERCIKLGMNGYISKPISQSMLQAKLNKYLPQIDPTVNPVVDTMSPDAITDNSGFNLAELQTMFGSKDDVDLLLSEFISSAKIDIAQLNNALQAGDFLQLAEVSHRLKGAAQMMLANNLSSLASQLEDAAKRHQQSQCETLYQQLNDCLAALSN